MKDDISDIVEYYNSDPEHETNRLERHQLELDLTWRYLERYLPARGKILEIGAATGRYTIDLARRGYQVTAVDMSAGLIEQCARHLAEAGLAKQVRLVVADARDLGTITESDHDAVLLMGPLYHLMLESDRQLALQQARARLRPGGVIFSAFISRYGVLGDIMQNIPDWVDDPEVASFMTRGCRPDDSPRGGFRGYFARIEEIIPLHEGAGFETLALAGMEPAISANDDSYNCLEGSRRQKWLDLLYAISAEPSLVGASRHLLYIGRKPGQ